MNSMQLAQQAYSPGSGVTRSARSVELQIFGEVTARLRAAASEGNTHIANLAAALHDNRRLWIRLAADVAGEGNNLPATLRARIFELAAFTTSHSSRVLQEDADPAILIEINTAMMRGLAGQLPDGAAA